MRKVLGGHGLYEADGKIPNEAECNKFIFFLLLSELSSLVTSKGPPLVCKVLRNCKVSPIRPQPGDCHASEAIAFCGKLTSTEV